MIITYPISLENRFKIRPDGFVSKNLIVVEIIPLNIALYSLCDARMQTAKYPIDLKCVAKAQNKKC